MAQVGGGRKKNVRRLCAVMLIGVMVCLCACGNNGGKAMYGNYGDSKSLISSAMIDSKGVLPYGTQDFQNAESFIKDNEKMIDAQIKLFKALAKSEDNSMVSPISLIYALGMAENGAGGKTLEELESLFGLDKDAMTQWLAAWGETFSKRSDVKVNLANSLWFRDDTDGRGGFEPKEEYLKVLANYFKAQAYSSAFDDRTVDDINAWCKENTFGMIEKIIDKMDSDKMAILLNAIAFEGEWIKEYEEESVLNDKFHKADGKTEDVKLMYSREDTYLKDEAATGFKKPYKGGYSYVAILPNEGVSIAQYMEKMSGEGFRNFIGSAEAAVVNSYLPKYKSEYSCDEVKEALKTLGVSTLFSPDDADLTGMGKSSLGNLYVGEVIQKTFIEVDEKGTKAAAVSRVDSMATTSLPMPKPEYTVRLDRPFIYAIVDDVTNTPVFIGTVTSVSGN